MAETARPRPVEYYNPRPLILGVCFLWGVAMGFCLYFFRAPEQMPSAGPDKPDIAVASPASPQSELERRRQDTPNIAVVESAPAPAAAKPTIEDIPLDPPPALLTTEGGLSGRTAKPLGRPPARAPAPGQARPSPLAPPPPLPELMP